jgi:hypothetical protein
MFSWFWSIATSTFNAVVAAVKSAVAWCWALLVDFLSACADWMIGLLPAGMQDFLTASPWTSMLDYLDLVDWFVPIYGCVGICLTVLGFVASIRLARWIMALIPRAFTGVD